MKGLTYSVKDVSLAERADLLSANPPIRKHEEQDGTQPVGIK